MISPWGLAIKPRMPTSWRTWDMLPRAPELAIIHTELSGSFSLKLRRTAATRRSLVSVQVSMTLVWRSTSVISPSR